MISNETFKMTVCAYKQIIDKISAEWEDDRNLAATKAWHSALSIYARRAADVGMDADAFHAAICRAQILFESFFAATDPFEGPKRMILWQHQTLNLFEAYDEVPGVNLQDLKATAASYVSEPFLQNNFFDWCILDALIFTETKAFISTMMATRFGTTPMNYAYAFCGGNAFSYYALRTLFWIMDILLSFVGPLVGGFYLLVNNHEYWGGGLLALFAWTVLARLFFLPTRWRAKKRSTKLLEKMLAIYGQLEGQTMSPRLFKEAINEGARDGIKLDGAVFAIADRMYERDPSAFVRDA